MLGDLSTFCSPFSFSVEFPGLSPLPIVVSSLTIGCVLSVNSLLKSFSIAYTSGFLESSLQELL